MKTTALLLLCLVFTANFCSGQNLVPNPSFEEYDTCPDDQGMVYRAKHWNSFGNSPEYYNSCSPLWEFSTPSNLAGFQEPKTGQAYTGAGFFASHDTISGSTYREFLGTKLTTPLVNGEKYYARFYVSVADSPNINNATNSRIGLLFTTQSFAIDPICPIPCQTSLLLPVNRSQVETHTIVESQDSWVEISGSFTADSNYQYVIIGNFFCNDSTNFSLIPNRPPSFSLGSYYYIDDVYVGIDSFTGFEQLEFLNDLRVFPNPASSMLHLQGNNTSGKLVTAYGAIISEFNIDKYKEIDVTGLPQGVYVLVYEKGDKSIARKKIIICQP